MADDLRQAAAQVDRWIAGLERLMNPTTGTVKHSHVRYRKEDLEDRWKVYEHRYFVIYFIKRKKYLADGWKVYR